jgi:hypothetical protein
VRLSDGFLDGIAKKASFFNAILRKYLAQDVDGAPFDDDVQPRFEGPPGIVSRPRAVDRQQNVLHDVIDAVSRHALAASQADDERHAIAQQRLIGYPIPRLDSGHQCRSAGVRFGSRPCSTLHWRPDPPLNQHGIPSPGNGQSSTGTESGAIDPGYHISLCHWPQCSANERFSSAFRAEVGESYIVIRIGRRG